MTCAGRSRSRSLALPVSARTCRTWSSGNVLAITPRLTWSLRRMPAGRPAGARAIAIARSRVSASMTQLQAYVNSIGARLKTRRDAGERATLEAAWRLLQGVGASPALDRIAALVGRELAARAGWSFVMVDPMAYAE